MGQPAARKMVPFSSSKEVSKSQGDCQAGRGFRPWVITVAAVMVSAAEASLKQDEAAIRDGRLGFGELAARWSALSLEANPVPVRWKCRTGTPAE